MSDNEDVTEKVERLENGLKWIRHIAFVHAIGGGFEPKHMYALADLCVRIIAGESLRDFTEAKEESDQRAHEQWEKFKTLFDDE